MTHETDPFEQSLSKLAEAVHENKQLTELFRTHLEGLRSTAIILGADPDEIKHYNPIAQRLVDIQTEADTNKRRNKERALLADFIACQTPRSAVDTTLSYFPMQPLTVEDTGLIAEKIAQQEVVFERKSEIRIEIKNLFDDLGLASKKQELNEVDKAFVGHLINHYYAILYETPEEDLARNRAQLLENVCIAVDKTGLHPVIMRIAAALLNKGT